jgi:hypothetical protein
MLLADKFTVEKWRVDILVADKFTVDKLTVEILVDDKFTVDKLTVEILVADKFTVDKFTIDTLVDKILVTLAYELVIFVKNTLTLDKFWIEQFDRYTKLELLPIWILFLEESIIKVSI